MHIWTLEKWKHKYDFNSSSHRSGLRLIFDKNVHPEVRRSCKEFGVWLRKEYYFPIRVPIYFKTSRKIKTRDGDFAYGSFFRPSNKDVEPYIRIAVGDYNILLEIWANKDNVLSTYLSCMAHELTHYFQWINDIELTKIGEERQATIYADYVVDEYAETREHP